MARAQLVARTHELKLMAVSLTPRLLSCSSSWNLMGNGGGMIDQALSCAGRWTRLSTYRKLWSPNEGAVRRNWVVGMMGKEVGLSGPGRSEAERATERRYQIRKEIRVSFGKYALPASATVTQKRGRGLWRLRNDCCLMKTSGSVRQERLRWILFEVTCPLGCSFPKSVESQQ